MRDDARAVLDMALKAWGVADEPPDLAHRRLRQAGLIAVAFDPADCSNVPEGSFTVASGGLRVGDEVFFVVTDSHDPETPNLARMVRDGGHWLLESLKFQCVSCFGTAVIGLTPCDVCGARGWGLADAEWVEWLLDLRACSNVYSPSRLSPPDDGWR